jgi:octaprenyl-diphosphate synthase
MALTAPAPRQAPPKQLIGQLGNVAVQRGLGDLASRLAELQAWIEGDLRDFEAELALVPRGASVVSLCAHHLLELGGKHLRPMCVALAARCGSGFAESGRRLAVAVELVHSATLLHDDVVDLGEVRRGAPAARRIYGNAASIFAGDWLLVEALRQVQRAEVPGLLDRMLAVIEEMILAESVQLESRGRINAEVADYFRVVEGKTAALFRWGLFAGGRAGGLGDRECDALERYGLHLGVAFQAVDDLLDVDGDAERTGKALFADLREGKMTYPLILALARDPELLPVIERCAAVEADEPLPAAAIRRVLDAVKRTEALADCRALAHHRANQAIDSLEPLGDHPGVRALITVAESTVYRES